MNSKAYLETRILSADPVELINIFYEYAILYVQEARDNLARKDIAARSKAIVKAIRIVSELEAALDHAAGGEIAANLGRLYAYMRSRLMTANVRQQDAPLAEVESLLKTVAKGWQGVSAAGRIRPEPAEDMPAVRWGGRAFSTDALSTCGVHSWSF
jgi:flagellar protein FliS